MKKFNLKDAVFIYQYRKRSEQDKYFVSIFGKSWVYFRNQCERNGIFSVKELGNISRDDFLRMYKPSIHNAWAAKTRSTKNAMRIYDAIFPERSPRKPSEIWLIKDPRDITRFHPRLCESLEEAVEFKKRIGARAEIIHYKEVKIFK